MTRANTAPVWTEPRALALLAAASLTTMANATISPALPGLERMFSDHPDAAILTRLLVTAPSLTVVLFAPLAGYVADRAGRRGVLIWGAVLFVLAGTAGLYLPDLNSILASRLVLGVAVAMVMTAQTALLGDYFTGDRRATMLGLQISARNLGGLVFILLAGGLATLGARLPFVVYGLAALMLPLFWVAVTEPQALHRGGTDSTAPEADGSPGWLPLLFGLAGLQMLTNMIFFLMPTQMPFFLASEGYDSAAMTGFVLGTLMLTGGGTAMLFGRVKRALGHVGAFALGYALMGIGFALLPFATWAIFAGAAFVGVGFATVMPVFVAIALAHAPARRRGFAGGLLTASVFIGQFASPLASQPVIARFGFDGGYYGTAGVVGVVALVCLVHGGIARRATVALRAEP